MKKILALAAASMLVSTASFAAERSAILSVPGMFCPSCPFIVQAAIQKVDGVVSVTADAEQRTALVVYDDAVTTLEAITMASTNAGYEATLIEDNS